MVVSYTISWPALKRNHSRETHDHRNRSHQSASFRSAPPSPLGRGVPAPGKGAVFMGPRIATGLFQKLSEMWNDTAGRCYLGSAWFFRTRWGVLELRFEQAVRRKPNEADREKPMNQNSFILL